MASMTASRLIELAERCERASGPDRELDLWIEVAINPQYEALDEEHARLLTKYGGHQAYTASLDAAMSLVPEGYAWNVNVFISRGPTASVYDRNAVGADGDAATPALAMTAACLRALAQGEK